MTIETASPIPRWQLITFWVCVGISILLALMAHLRIHVTLIDDAFITFRYAANLAEGRGLVFNEGERVLGTTSPGYAILLAGIGAVAGWEAIPAAARVINFIALIIMAGAFSRAAWKLTGAMLIVALVFAISMLGTETLLASVAGMESIVFMAITALGLLAVIEKRWWLAVGLISMLPLFRPEAVFVMGMMGITLLLHYRELGLRKVILLSLVMALPGVIWAIFSQVYYGSVLPHSIIAKQKGLYPVGVIGSTVLTMDFMIHSLTLITAFPVQRKIVVGIIGFLMTILITLALLIPGAIRFAKQYKPIAPFAAMPFIFLIFYATSKTLLLPHYFAHFEVPMKIVWWVGLFAMITALLERMKIEKWPLVGTITGLIVLLPCLWLYDWRSIISGKVVTSEIDPYVYRNEAYYAIAHTIGERIPAGTTILMPEIGEVAFYMPHVKVLDSAGLVSPEALPYHPVNDELGVSPNMGVIPPQMVADYQPDMIITLEVLGRFALIDEAWFQEQYTPVITMTGSWLPWDSKALYVFSRKDFEPGMALQGTEIPYNGPQP
jgi:hypothetical protein